MNPSFNSNIKLIMGGSYYGGSEWNKSANEVDNCYKLYYLKEGQAELQSNGYSFPITGPNLYYINGYAIESQRCIEKIRVDWIHFQPESVYFNHILKQSSCVVPLKKEQYFSLTDLSMLLDPFFHNELNRIQSQIVQLKILAILHQLIADIFGILDTKLFEDDDTIIRLLPALEYMTNNFNKALKLEDAAEVACLSPNYFHRLFCQAFEISPLVYLRTIRLEEAIRQLVYTHKSVKEIAYAVGYDDEAYFSRVFSNQYNMSPGKYRKKFGEKLP